MRKGAYATRSAALLLVVSLSAAVMAGALASSGCTFPSIPGFSRAKPEVPVGYRDISGAAPLLLAVSRGGPRDAAFRLGARRYESSPKLNEAIKSGEVSMAVVPLLTAAGLYLDGAPIVVVGATAESYGRDGIAVTDRLDSLDELAGQKVAVTSKSGAFFLWTMLSRAGIDPVSVIAESVPYAKAVRALGTDYEAAVLSGTPLYEASRTAGRRVIMTTQDFPGVLVDVVVVDKAYAEAHPETVQAVVESMAQAGADLTSDPASMDASVSAQAGVSPARAAAARRGLRYLDRPKAVELLGVVGAPGAIQEVAQEALQFIAEGRQAQAPSDTSGFVDSRYLNPAKR